MIISFHPPITGNVMNCWDLIEILTDKYKHQIISHNDPCFFGSKPPFSSVPEAGYQYYLEAVSQGLPSKMLVLGNCFGALTAWESTRHLRKAGVNVLFCAISPAKWIYPEKRETTWTDKYPPPLGDVMKAYVKASEVYTPSPINEIKPYFIISKSSSLPNDWLGLCPNNKIGTIQALPHSLTQYRFGGVAPLTASLIDEFTRLN